jgi:hypothetical protein
VVKRSIFVALGLLIFAGTAFARPGHIGLFADPTLAECNIGIPPSGIIHVYVGHVNMESSASQFCVDYQGLMVGANLFLSETPTAPILAIGTSDCNDRHDRIGISLAYGQCLVGSHMILDLQFFIQSPVALCTCVGVLPDPAFDPPLGAIASASCDTPPVYEFPTGGTAIANYDWDLCPSCFCTVPVAESTWGGIKALYR